MRARLLAVAFAAGVLGCEPDASDPPPVASSTSETEASAVPPPSASLSVAAPADALAKVGVRGTLGKAKIELVSGYARLKDGALHVSLVDRAIACGEKIAPDAQVLKLIVPPSSDGRFFTGSTFGVPVDREPGLAYYSPEKSMLTVIGAEPRPGGSLRLSLVVSGKDSSDGPALEVAGEASVPICAAAGEMLLTVEAPADDALKVVNAFAKRRADRTIDQVWLFIEKPGSCAAFMKPNRFTFYRLIDIGSARLKGAVASGPQPVVPGYHFPVADYLPSGGPASQTGYAEITWNSLDIKPGEKLAGTLAMWSWSGERNGSAVLEATVCP